MVLSYSADFKAPLVNFGGPAGIVDATVYKTAIFLGFGHGKLFYFLTLHAVRLVWVSFIK